MRSLRCGHAREGETRTALYTYPDLAVAMRRTRVSRTISIDTLLNPTLLIEVLSPSTEALRSYCQVSLTIERWSLWLNISWLLRDEDSRGGNTSSRQTASGVASSNT